MSRLGSVFLLMAAVGACDPATLRHTPDATKPIDGAPDAPNHGPVTVTLFDPSTPGTLVPNSPVVFIEADGTVAAKSTTDAVGIAKGDVHANATVTAIIIAQGTTTMMTVEGVQPGDNILLGPSQVPPPNNAGTFTVSWPAYSGAASYNLVGPCDYPNVGNVTTYAMTVNDSCKQSTMDLIVVANNSANQAIAYLEKPNVAYTNGGSTFISGTFLPPGTFNSTYSNVDAGVTGISFTRYAPANTGYVSVASGTPANGTLSLTGLELNAQTSSVQTHVGKPMLSQDVYQNMPGNALTYTMDVGATLLPWIGPAMVDVANQKVTVTVDTTGTTNDKPDLFFTSFAYTRSNGSAGSTSFRWIVFAQDIGDVALPKIPADVADVMPQATDTAGTPIVVAFDSSAPDVTWDAARAAPFDFTIANNFPTRVDTTTRTRVSRVVIGR